METQLPKTYGIQGRSKMVEQKEPESTCSHTDPKSIPTHRKIHTEEKVGLSEHLLHNER